MAVTIFGDKSLDLSRPQIMGILNVTPDSFSDGGSFSNLDDALFQTQKMLSEGASIIDVGGESTRPGASPVSLEEELGRVIPVVAAIKSRFDVVVSVDTSSAQVMTEGAKQGAGLINDVRALTRDGALDAAVETGLPVCLMHMQGSPESMQMNPNYSAVYNEVISFLLERARVCQALGMKPEQILLDPGIGFGKTLEHNLELLNNIDQILSHDFDVLIGASRKSMIGQVLNADVQDRLFGTLGAHAAAFSKGASIFRVHDVKPHHDMLELMYRIKREE
ncbi:dihydropteroate synthase [Marinomonas sp. S3726]|uniref:dihydropteroate synthase n=1 Tax=Marinomonas sp. S3726 TaxID=579484 RepID=UPI0005F9C7C8|nr:dihydropteroate synthase [Marinomonas sp. S3726]KJZ14765.1 dihydropteroate synthase [Marinomonas sp. S3726]